jgi:hypothetical protein
MTIQMINKKKDWQITMTGLIGGKPKYLKFIPLVMNKFQ